MVSAAQNLLRQVEEGRQGVDPEVVELCRQMVAAQHTHGHAVENGLAAISRVRARSNVDPHRISHAEAASDAMAVMERARIEMERAGARILELVGPDFEGGR